jgi:ParB-like chromosome segregation protein Spo0J
MTKPRLQVQTMKTSDLIPYVRNAKQHPEEQVAQIAASIREFGMNDPVAV